VKTDSLFYRLFQNHPDLVFQLIGDNSPRSGTYEFGSQEVKQLSFRIDGVLNPSADAVGLPVVFVEVQGYRDQKKTLYHSFFAEIFLYLRDYQPPHDWLGILISPGGVLTHSYRPTFRTMPRVPASSVSTWMSYQASWLSSR
jgi:predicted transposase YdaD